MKRIFIVLSGLLVFGAIQVSAQTPGTQAQVRVNRCGVQQYHEAMIAKNPAMAEKYRNQKASLQAAADYYLQYKNAGRAEKTTTTISPVPVIFHIIVDSAQFNALGGTDGIIKRCDSQIAVLNADYNQQNYDSSLIPSSWKPLYGNVGIHFALARVDPGGNCTPGYEVKIIAGSTATDAGFDAICDAFPQAKTAGTGLPSWDYTKYYNVWCINYTNGSTTDQCLQAEGLLGLTVSLSDGGPTNQVGVCILYTTLGSTGRTNTAPTGTGAWDTEYDRGRTLTHETGHFFEIWHPWGDDNGACPWSSGGDDDGLSDTPPESDNVYGNPTYTITGGTFNDACQMHGSANTQPIGIACLTYMDYTDDVAMHMFTTQQAAAMASMALVPGSSSIGATGYGTIGESFSLTQHPELIIPCSVGVAAAPTGFNSSLNVYPNPTNGALNISLNPSAETLKNIVVINLLGQQVATISGQQGKDYYSIDLSGMSKGIYIVKCNFASGSVVRKIMLQ